MSHASGRKLLKAQLWRLARALRACVLPILLASTSPVYGADLTQIVDAHVRQRLGVAENRLVVSVRASPAQTSKARRCRQLTAFDPPGAKFARRGYVGVRCATTPIWRMWIPVHIQRFGALAVSARALARGSIVAAADIKMIEGDIAALPTDAVIDPGRLIGKEVTQTIAAGKSIRIRQLRTPRLIQRGDSVQVVIKGHGYQASSRGVALAAGGLDENVKVRMPSGVVLSGRVSSAGRIAVAR